LWRVWAPTTPRASRPHLADTRDDSFPGDGDEGGLALLLIFLVDSCVFQRALVRVLKLVPVLGIKRLLHERRDESSAQTKYKNRGERCRTGTPDYAGLPHISALHLHCCRVHVSESRGARQTQTIQHVFACCDPSNNNCKPPPRWWGIHHLLLRLELVGVDSIGELLQVLFDCHDRSAELKILLSLKRRGDLRGDPSVTL